MGRLMTLKVKGKNQSITLSKSQVNEFNRRAKEAEMQLRGETVSLTSLLFCAYLMDEPEFECDGYRLARMYERVNDWAEHIEDHLLTVKDIAKIISENTDLEIIWKSEE